MGCNGRKTNKLISVRGWVNPTDIVRPEGFSECKILMATSGIERVLKYMSSLKFISLVLFFVEIYYIRGDYIEDRASCLQRSNIQVAYLLKSVSLTPRSTVLLEKVTGSQLVNKFPTFYGTQKFITAFTSACHLSVSWAGSIQSISVHPTSWTSILILSSHLR